MASHLNLRLVVLASLLVCLSACSGRSNSLQADEQPYLMHVVLVWLKQPGNAEHQARIIEASRVLANIPGVQELRVGRVVSSERAVVEDSYDVALSMRFDNVQALQAYLTHPLHVGTVKSEFMPIMERYQVIDFRSP